MDRLSLAPQNLDRIPPVPEGSVVRKYENAATERAFQQMVAKIEDEVSRLPLNQQYAVRARYGLLRTTGKAIEKRSPSRLTARAKRLEVTALRDLYTRKLHRIQPLDETSDE